MIQFLAGAPELLSRYRNAPPAAKALIHAAMDAHRLGVRGGLPEAFLEAAAPGYLTDAEWDLLGEDWLEQALAYTAVRCKGVRGPLTRIRPRPARHAVSTRTNQVGSLAPAAGPLYQLADYLDQYALQKRQGVPVPDAVWRALVDHHRSDQASLARSALEHQKRRYARAFFLKAGREGDQVSIWTLADSLVNEDRIDDAMMVLGPATERGFVLCADRLADLLADRGRVDDAIAILRWYAEHGSQLSTAHLGNLLTRQGRVAEAMTLYRWHATQGDQGAGVLLAEILAGQGQVDEAVAILEELADADANNIFAGSRLAGLLAGSRQVDKLRDRSRNGDRKATQELARMLKNQGKVDEAITNLRERNNAGDRGAIHQLVDLLADQGHAQEAIALLRKTGDASRSLDIVKLAKLLISQGELDKASTLLWKCAEIVKDKGDDFLELVTDPDIGDEWVDKIEELIDLIAMEGARLLADLLARRGQLDEAIAVLRSSERYGDRAASLQLAELSGKHRLKDQHVQ